MSAVSRLAQWFDEFHYAFFSVSTMINVGLLLLVLRLAVARPALTRADRRAYSRLGRVPARDVVVGSSSRTGGERRRASTNCRSEVIA